MILVILFYFNESLLKSYHYFFIILYPTWVKYPLARDAGENLLSISESINLVPSMKEEVNMLM